MQVESALYIIDKEGKQLRLVCNSQEGIIREQRPVRTGICLPLTDDAKLQETLNDLIEDIF